MGKFKKSIIILASIVILGFLGFSNHTQALTLDQALAEIGTIGKINEASSNIQELAATAYIKERISGTSKEDALNILSKSIKYEDKTTVNGATIYKGRVGDTNYFKTSDSNWQYVANNPNMNFNEFKNDRYILQNNSYELKSIDVENNGINPQINNQSQNGSILVRQQATQAPGQTTAGQQTPGQTTSSQQQTPGQIGTTTPGQTTAGGTTAGGTTATGSGNANATTDCGSEGLAGQRFLFFHGPLVPCGINKHCASDTGGSINKPCTICHFFVLIQNFFNLLLSLLIVVSIFMLTVAGVLYIISAGGKMATTAKEIIHKTLLGFGLFLLSWLIVFTLLKLLDVNTSMLGTGSGWFQFTCDDESAFWVPTNNGIVRPTPGIPVRPTPGVPVQPTPGAPVKPDPGTTPPPVSTNDTYNNEEARKVLGDAGVNIKNGVKVDGLQKVSADGLSNFNKQCNSAMSARCETILTAGLDGTHKTGTQFTHANGYKTDIRSRNTTPNLNKFLIGTNNTAQAGNIAVGSKPGYLTRVGVREDGAILFKDPYGHPWALEDQGNNQNEHWDVNWGKKI